MSLPESTLRALLSPRRAIPLAAFGALLVIVELVNAPSVSVALFTAVLYGAFVTLAPLSFRSLGRSVTGRLLHAVNGVVCTFVFGVMLRKAWLPNPTLLTDAVGLVAIMGGFWVGGYSVGRDIDLEDALLRAEANAKAAQQHAEHAQLLALRTHLDPHFLFNTLNAIAEWCREAPEVAELATLKLSEMLRSILDATKHPTWSFARELGLVQDLFALYAVRDANRYVLETDVDQAARNIQVPPLLLLTLVENAIKHGPAAGKHGKVFLVARFDAHGALQIHVKNPGEYTGPRPGGEGLAMIRRRLQHACSKGARFEIASSHGATVAELYLPQAEVAT